MYSKIMKKNRREIMSKLIHILPFMDNDDLKELANKIISGEVKGVKMHMLYPFLSKSDLNEIIKTMIEKDDIANLKYVLPFASKEMVQQIYDGVKEGKIKGLKEHYLYPFLEKDKIKEMFNDLVSKAAEESDEDVEDDDEEVD